MIEPSLPLLLKAAICGVIATLIMDALATLFKHAGLLDGVSYPLIGRWTGWIFKGRIRHRSILDAYPIKGEREIGLVVHYSIGAALGVVYLLLFSATNLPINQHVTAFVYGALTSSLPWFVLFPSCGFQIFGKGGPPGSRPFRTSLFNHAFFGLGLALAVRLVLGLAPWLST